MSKPKTEVYTKHAATVLLNLLPTCKVKLTKMKGRFSTLDIGVIVKELKR